MLCGGDLIKRIFSSAEGHAVLKSEMSALNRQFSLCKINAKSFNIQELLHCKSKSKRHGTKAHAPFPSWELSKDTKNMIWSIPVLWRSHLYNTKQNKTNYLPSLINNVLFKYTSKISPSASWACLTLFEPLHILKHEANTIIR